tara:strand:- start:147 stop:470 length:324 start_codon:yes stop_codon:yes gene_type:complete
MSQRQYVLLSFPRWCHAHDLPIPVAEHRFDEVRRWRFDWSWPDHRVALEQHGGVWIAGRHSGGAGQIRDFEKFSEAAAQGWRIIHVTPQQLESDRTIDWLRRSLNCR